MYIWRYIKEYISPNCYHVYVSKCLCAREKLMLLIRRSDLYNKIMCFLQFVYFPFLVCIRATAATKKQPDVLLKTFSLNLFSSIHIHIHILCKYIFNFFFRSFMLLKVSVSLFVSEFFA